MRIFLFLFIILGGLGPFVLKAQKPLKHITVGFYNLENLFDTIDSPDTDDAEFLPDAGWTNKRYKHKLNQLSRVIDSLGGEGGPDYLGVCEVENRGVLEQLTATELLSDQEYQIVHAESADPRGIDVGFLYSSSLNFEVIQQHAFRLYMPDTQLVRTRDVLWVLGHTGKKDTLGFFICHWPSRRSGERAERYRYYIGNRMREITDSLAVLYPGASWILMGDLNDEPTDRSVHEGLKALSTQDSACSLGTYFNPMYAMQAMGDGSHSYKQEWHMLDQILFRPCLKNQKAGLTLVGNSAEVYRPKWMQSTHEKYYGEPYRTFAGKNYLGGFSDHFPVYVKLRLGR